jgi:uncharacterized protein (TIGR02265 family)
MESLLVRGVGDRLDAGARAQLREIGVDIDAPLAPGYRVEQWVAAVSIAGRAAFGALHPDPDDQVFQLGRALLGGLGQTERGASLLRYARVAGPRRTLAQLGTAMRAVNNYKDMELHDSPEGLVLEARVFPRVLPRMIGLPIPSPHFIRGIAHACLELAGAREISVALRSHDPVARHTFYGVSFTSS